MALLDGLDQPPLDEEGHDGHAEPQHGAFERAKKSAPRLSRSVLPLAGHAI